MIKAFSRFMLMLLLCTLLVYAPELLASVSAPYSLAAPQRILLRIVLCCDDEASAHILAAINAYQKEHTFVHLRVSRMSNVQLRALTAPYPDVIICDQTPTDRLPSDFTRPAQIICLTGDCTLLCAVSSDAGARFVAYIDEAFPPPQTQSEI